jgi:hypothetical protein
VKVGGLLGAALVYRAAAPGAQVRRASSIAPTAKDQRDATYASDFELLHCDNQVVKTCSESRPELLPALHCGAIEFGHG